MKRNRRPWWLSEAIRLDAEGRSSRDAAEMLKRAAKPGQKGPGRTTIDRWLAAERGGAKVPASTVTIPEPAPPPEPVPLDESAMQPEDLAGLLAGLLRQQHALAQRLGAEGDHIGAQRATRTATSIAVQLAKQQAREDVDSDSVRVTVKDMQISAERATSALFSLAERVAAERSSWPTCPTCGLPSGSYPAGDKSPLRAMVERVFGRGP